MALVVVTCWVVACELITLLTCRVIGVSDLCDFPPEAAAKPKVSRSCFNSAEMTSAEVSAFCTYVHICFCTCLYMLAEEDLEVILPK